MSNKKIPMRQCVGCHEMKAKREMIRVIKTAPTEEGETEIILDATGRKNGRGAYICNDIECLRKARKNKGLERSFKMPVPPEVYEQIEKEFIESEQQKA